MTAKSKSSLTNIKQKLFAGLVAAAAIVVCISLLSVSAIRSLLLAVGRVEHTQQVKNELRLVLSHVLEVQSADRGFLLAGDDRYLLSHKEASRELPTIVNNLRLQTTDNPHQQQMFLSLARLVEERVAFSSQVIFIRKTKGETRARSLFETGRGKSLTDSVRVLIAQMIAEEDRRLQRRREVETGQANRNELIIYLSLGVQVMLLAFIFVVVKRDVAGRRKAEDRFRLVVESAPNAIILVDSTGIIRLVNAQVERYFGYNRDELLGKKIEMLVPKENAVDHTALRSSFFSHPDIRSMGKGRDLFGLRKDGSKIPIEVGLNPIHFEEEMLVLASIIDIAERKQTEEALKDSEQRLTLALDSSQMGAWDLDLIHDTAVRSLKHDQIFGYDSLLPRWGAEIFMKHIVPEDRDQVQKKFQEAFTAGNLYFECRIIRPDKSVRWIAAQGRAYRNEEGTPVRMMGVVSDITDRKRAEEAARQLNADLAKQSAQLEAANKELEAFSYSVSHDLRAPLRHISGFVELLERNIQSTLDEKSRKHLKTISESALHMGQLIDDLLVFSKMGRAEMMKSRVDLKLLIEGLVRDSAVETVGRSVEWKIGQLPVVQGDPSMLRMVFVNLLSNSVKYTRTREHARIEISEQPGKNGDCVIAVKDNGVGFDPKYGHKLFGVFQRLHGSDEFEGTGIGLATVRRIVHRHGGTTWAEGEPDNGATIYCTLPKYEGLT